MSNFTAEDASLPALEARATAAEQRLTAIEIRAAGVSSEGAQAAPAVAAQPGTEAVMAASPMAKYTAELQGIRTVLVQAKDDQLVLEAKLKLATAKHEKQDYRIQHLIRSFKESEAAREVVEKELAMLKSGVATV